MNFISDLKMLKIHSTQYANLGYILKPALSKSALHKTALSKDLLYRDTLKYSRFKQFIFMIDRVVNLLAPKNLELSSTY